ncbi:hypothetical protein RUND412_002034 [Rhizina undulata]
MLNNSVSGSSVNNENNHISDSGNSNTTILIGSLTVQARTRASGAHHSVREDFEEFKVPVKLPFQRNHNFCGRDAILEQLNQILNRPNTSENHSGRKVAILHGMGGLGKSEIALEYAHRDRGYTSIFWIDAENDSRLNKSAVEVMEQLVAHYATKWSSSPDYFEIAHTLGIPGKINDSGRMIQSATETGLEVVYNWLGRNENRDWLLVIDNKDKAENDDFHKLLPLGNWGSVIITSRLSNLHQFGHGQCIEIDGIGEDGGLQLLLKISGLSQENLGDSEIADGNEIVKALGQLPLALDQAASYMCSKKIAFSAYRKKYDELAMEIFKEGLSGRRLSPEKASVLTTWELSFRELSDDARQLLQLCAFLSNEDIPEELFRRGKKAVDWIMEDLTRQWKIFSLTPWRREKTRGTAFGFTRWFTPGRVIGLIVQQRQNAETAVTLVTSTIVTHQNERSSAYWMFTRRIVSHLNICQHHIVQHFSGPNDTLKAAEASSTFGSVYEQLGLYHQARDSYLCALDGKEKVLESDHPDVLATVQNMASLFKYQGRYEKSLEMYRRAVKGYSAALGSDHPSTLLSLDGIASVLGIQGQNSEALAMFQKALKVREKTVGHDHPSTLATVHSIAGVLKNKRRYEEALEMYQRALTGREKVLGSDHPDTLVTVHNIASLSKHQKQYNEAFDMYQRALVGNEKALGNDHPSTLNSMDGIASVFRKQERYKDAMEMYQRALAGKEKALGSNHPSFLFLLHHLFLLFKFGFSIGGAEWNL